MRFFVTAAARFERLYVFLLLDVNTRRLVHWNVTAHPTSEWTVQQVRMCVTGETTHRYLVHDRDCIYSPAVDGALHAMGLQVLKSPVMAPQGNAHCERVIGTVRPECLDWVIPLNERHLRRVLAELVAHYPSRATACGARRRSAGGHSARRSHSVKASTVARVSGDSATHSRGSPPQVRPRSDAA